VGAGGQKLPRLIHRVLISQIGAQQSFSRSSFGKRSGLFLLHKPFAALIELPMAAHYVSVRLTRRSGRS